MGLSTLWFQYNRYTAVAEDLHQHLSGFIGRLDWLKRLKNDTCCHTHLYVAYTHVVAYMLRQQALYS